MHLRRHHFLLWALLVIPLDGMAQPTSRDQSLESILEAWYPTAVDTAYGGYLSTFTYDWEPVGDQTKFVVTQARHVWTTARASLMDLDYDPGYLEMSYQGYRFLRDAMYDHVNGGFGSLTTREGERIPAPGEFTSGKTAYGNAFGLYALAAFYEASGDQTVLDFAKEAFKWLDDSAHDAVHGGYYQFMADDGTPERNGRGNHSAKDQNSSIHLLEAFTELYRIWPNPLLRDRLHEMLVVVRDTITHDEGYLQLFFEEDWTPISFRDSSESVIRQNLGVDHVSFGHDIETAFLMMEAAELLGVEQNETLKKGKKMVDHALSWGWDDEYGGFHDGGYYFDRGARREIVNEEKTWWVQAEAMNALQLMAEHFPNDRQNYAALLAEQIRYIDKYVIDHEYGGWYWAGLDRSPTRKHFQKANIWKGAYHDGRALMNAVKQQSGGHK
ncbi:AGE family epimerase/isomerase [Bacteroidota bacterium]